MSQSMPTLTNTAVPARRVRFRDLLQPMAPEEFLDRYFDREPACTFPGPADRFAEVFSWDRGDGAAGHDDHLVRIHAEGGAGRRAGASVAVLLAGQNRDGTPIQQPDPVKVQALIRRGATISLNLVETISPEIAGIAAALQCWLGGEAVCNIYCSWGGHQGFQSHFDFHDVFVLQIDGQEGVEHLRGPVRRIREYRGASGRTSFSDEYVRQARGPVKHGSHDDARRRPLHSAGAIPRRPRHQRGHAASDLRRGIPQRLLSPRRDRQ